MAKFTINYYFGNGNSVHQTIEAEDLDSAQEAIRKRVSLTAPPPHESAPRESGLFHVDAGSHRYVIPKASLQYCLIVPSGEGGSDQGNYAQDEQEGATGEARYE